MMRRSHAVTRDGLRGFGGGSGQIVLSPCMIAAEAKVARAIVTLSAIHPAYQER